MTGATIVTTYPPKKNQTINDTYQTLCAHLMSLEELSSKKIKNVSQRSFELTCETFKYKPTDKDEIKTLNIFSDSDIESSVHIKMDDSSSCFETARTFQNILLATASTLNLRTRIESKGMRYRIDDFLIRASLVSQSNIPKGIFLEICYLPYAVLTHCIALIREFMANQIGFSDLKVAHHLGGLKKGASFTYKDVVFQYLEVFDEFRHSNSSSNLSQGV